MRARADLVDLAPTLVYRQSQAQNVFVKLHRGWQVPVIEERDCQLIGGVWSVHTVPAFAWFAFGFVAS